MVRPASFGFNVQTAANNAFQGTLDLSAQAIQQHAEAEFDVFVTRVRSVGVHVWVIQDTPSPAKPDAVFPNNWFCTLPDGNLHLFPMYAPIRRLERRPEILESIVENFEVGQVKDWSDAEREDLILEGTGSMIFDHVHRLAFDCLSPRTNASLMEQFCREINYTPVLFSSEDENGVLIYHTNVMLHIAAEYSVVCLESIRSAEERAHVLSLLSLGGKQIIDISLSQVRSYAGNMLQVENAKGELFTVMSEQASSSLSPKQKGIIEVSSQILVVKIPVIETIGGGSARCMMAEIFFDSKGADSCGSLSR